MNGITQVGAPNAFSALLDQRQQPQQLHAGAFVNPMSLAMAMGQPAGFQLHQPVKADVTAVEVSKPSQSSMEVHNTIKKLMHVDMIPESNPEGPIVPTAVESALMTLVDPSTLALVSPGKVKRFVNTFHRAKTEPEQALVLVILRATTASSEAKLARSCASAFEVSGGLKVAKQWLEAAVTWNYSDLLVLLLDVLKRIPLQLTSITEARINEPIVKLRKGAREEKVKRAAQDLLKHWRSKFTEKPAAPPAAPAATPSLSAATESVAKATSPRALASSAASSTQSGTTTASSSSSSSSSSTTTATSSPPKVSKLVGKMIKRRPIKRLERLPFGGGNAVSKSSSSELIGNLMQRKSDKEAKEAAAAASEASSPREGSSGADTDASSATGSASPPSSSSETTTTAVSDSIPMELPTIQSFKAAASAPSKSSKRIRWADQNGEELVKIKLIESWRDMVHYTPHDENAFRDAKLREHADERNAMKSHRDPVRSSFKLTLAHNWRSPAFVQLPDALAARRRPLQTDEMHVQSSRTRREMEYLVLDGEVPPPTPKEWVRAPNDIPRGPPLEIPLSDVAEPAPAPADAAATPGGSMLPPPGPGHYEYETEEDRALREALGPLSKATIAVLMDNEDALPQVYDEAQRNGNRIPDGRVLEIIDYHRRARGAPPLHMDPGFANFNKYGGGPPMPPQPQHSRYGGGFDAPPMNAPGMPPYGVSPPNAFGKKRKAPGQGPGAFNEAPPAKRMSKRGTVPCLFFNTPRGCKNGVNCTFLHEVSMGNLGNPGAVGGGYGQPMHDMGGPPRHQFRGGR